MAFKSRIVFLTSTVLLLVLLVVLPILLPYGYFGEGQFYFYLGIKLACLFFYLVTAIYLILPRRGQGISYWLVIAALLLQLLPLAVRLLSLLPEGNLYWGVSITVTVLAFLVYLVFSGLIAMQGRIMAKSDVAYQGREIKVKDDHELFDENNFLK